jgi:hypothetical protein
MNKEQQKQHLIDMMKADEELGLYDETIIQAKYRLYKEHWNEDHTQLVKSNFLIGFDEGAKWQKERSYSEEEVKNLFRKYQYDLAQWILRMEDDINSRPIPTEWFEQYKKK